MRLAVQKSVLRVAERLLKQGLNPLQILFAATWAEDEIRRFLDSTEGATSAPPILLFLLDPDSRNDASRMRYIRRNRESKAVERLDPSKVPDLLRRCPQTLESPRIRVVVQNADGLPEAVEKSLRSSQEFAASFARKTFTTLAIDKVNAAMAEGESERSVTSRVAEEFGSSPSALRTAKSRARKGAGKPAIKYKRRGGKWK